MELLRPPPDTNEALTEYLDRQFKVVENELLSAAGIVLLNTFPSRPRIGRIYSIDGEFYYHNNDQWFSITSDPYTPQVTIDEPRTY